MIWAQDKSAGIGLNGSMPWYLPEDLTFFKFQTSGHKVIMGSKSYLALPKKFRPLKNRENYVITRDLNSDFAITARNEGAYVISLFDAIRLISNYKNSLNDIFIIGGGFIYKSLIEYADELIVTQIDADFKCDTFAPIIPAYFKQVKRECQEISSTNLKWEVQFYRKMDNLNVVNNSSDSFNNTPDYNVTYV